MSERQKEERRWKVYVCPECGEKLPLTPTRRHLHGAFPGWPGRHVEGDEVELMPVSEHLEERERLEAERDKALRERDMAYGQKDLDPFVGDDGEPYSPATPREQMFLSAASQAETQRDEALKKHENAVAAIEQAEENLMAIEQKNTDLHRELSSLKAGLRGEVERHREAGRADEAEGGQPAGARARIHHEAASRLEALTQQCPDAPICQSCPASTEDDVCLPGERREAEVQQETKCETCGGSGDGRIGMFGEFIPWSARHPKGSIQAHPCPDCGTGKAPQEPEETKSTIAERVKNIDAAGKRAAALGRSAAAKLRGQQGGEGSVEETIADLRDRAALYRDGAARAKTVEVGEAKLAEARAWDAAADDLEISQEPPEYKSKLAGEQ